MARHAQSAADRKRRFEAVLLGRQQLANHPVDRAGADLGLVAQTTRNARQECRPVKRVQRRGGLRYSGANATSARTAQA